MYTVIQSVEYQYWVGGEKVKEWLQNRDLLRNPLAKMWSQNVTTSEFNHWSLEVCSKRFFSVLNADLRVP